MAGSASRAAERDESNHVPVRRGRSDLHWQEHQVRILVPVPPLVCAHANNLVQLARDLQARAHIPPKLRNRARDARHRVADVQRMVREAAELPHKVQAQNRPGRFETRQLGVKP